MTHQDHVHSHNCGHLSTDWSLGDLKRIFRWIIFKLILWIDGWVVAWDIALRWISLDLTNNKSTLVHVMAWCHQTSSHYLSQCWHSSVSPDNVNRTQSVNCFSAFSVYFLEIIYFLLNWKFFATTLQLGTWFWYWKSMMQNILHFPQHFYLPEITWLHLLSWFIKSDDAWDFRRLEFEFF